MKRVYGMITGKSHIDFLAQCVIMKLAGGGGGGGGGEAVTNDVFKFRKLSNSKVHAL